MAEHQLDCKGMKCPMPIVEVFRKFSSVGIGDTLEIQSDDLAFPHDIEAWCNRMGQDLVEVKTTGGIVSAKIKKVK